MAGRKKKTADESTDEIIVLCRPVGVTAPVPGSRRVPCSGCKQIVWLSAATEKHVSGKTYRVLCDECVSKEAGDDDVEVMPVAEGQIEEMLAALPGISRADILKRLPAKSPARRKAAIEEILREARKRRRLKN